METHDRLIQGMASEGDFRILAAQTTHAVEEARLCHDLSPVATDALGRALTGAVLLARLLEKQMRNQRVTLRFQGDGPLGIMIAEGSLGGAVRGYVSNPVPLESGLKVNDAIGRKGLFTVIRGVPPEGTPYTTQLALSGSGVAQEVTQYLAISEQIASAVLLGVLNRRDGVAAAGGIIIQAFPHTTDEKIAAVEKRIRETPPLSTLIEKMPIEDVVAQVFHGMDYKPIDSALNVPVTYSCSCTRQRALAPLTLFSPEEIREMIATGGSEVVCEFCGRKYAFSSEDLLPLTATYEA
jgi:molecular chaperone Hsp33